MTEKNQILIIEDEEDLRIILATYLRNANFEVLQAVNGLEGVKLARYHRPDLIICDVAMPALDGYGVIDQLMNDPQTATIPFIFLTALSDHASFRHSMELGADDFLTKPVSKIELIKAINTRLNRKHALTQPYQKRVSQAEQQLLYLRYQDPLTGLANQTHFFNALNTTLSQPYCPNLALLYLRIDCHRLNETLGRASGNAFLKISAQRLADSLAQFNHQLARLEGGRFAIVLTGIKHKQSVIEAAQTILESLAAPFNLNQQNFFAAVNMGISIYPQDGKDQESLFRAAERALGQSVQAGTYNYSFYDQSRSLASPALDLAEGLHETIRRNELELYYQPQVNLNSGQVIGAEALVRWQHPNKGLILPDQIIPLAEELGLLETLGRQVLEKACHQNQIWQERYHRSLRISVNLAASQFNRPDLAHLVTETLQNYHLSPESLELELTEETLMRDLDTSLATMYQLKELGVRLAIDDFGTRYSSLNYLKRLPFDSLKIDRSFIQEVATDPRSKAIAAAIIQMAQRLKLTVIAEGVETYEQLEVLYETQCEEAQGYLFSRPLPVAEFEKHFLANTRPFHAAKSLLGV